MSTSLEQYRAAALLNDQAFDVYTASDSLMTDLFRGLSDKDQATLETERQASLDDWNESMHDEGDEDIDDAH